MRLYLARSIFHEAQPLCYVTPPLTQTCAQQPAPSARLGRQQVTLPSPSILNSFIFPPPTSSFFFFLENPLFFSQWGRSFDDSSSLCHVPGCLSSRSSSTLMTRALLVLPFTHRCGIDSCIGRKGGGSVCYSEHFLGGYAREPTTIAHSSHTV